MKRKAPTPGPLPAAAGFSDDRARAIYDRYTAERRRNNEGEVRFETFAKSLRDMIPKLEEKAPGKKVDFEVVVKDGKTILKPVAK